MKARASGLWWSIRLEERPDLSRKLGAVRARSQADLVAQFGSTGLSNGPRTGPGKRTRESNEAYLVRRLFLSLAEQGAIRFPVTIVHQDSPDFLVEENGEAWGLEVTEACPQTDGHEMAIVEGKSEPSLLGAFGGRGAGGFFGNAAENAIVQDVQATLREKAAKPYVNDRPTDLLIYPNSNPVRVMSRPDQYEFVEHAAYDRGKLRRVFLYWQHNRIVEIPLVKL